MRLAESSFPLFVPDFDVLNNDLVGFVPWVKGIDPITQLPRINKMKELHANLDTHGVSDFFIQYKREHGLLEPTPNVNIQDL